MITQSKILTQHTFYLESSASRLSLIVTMSPSLSSTTIPSMMKPTAPPHPLLNTLKVSARWTVQIGNKPLNLSVMQYDSCLNHATIILEHCDTKLEMILIGKDQLGWIQWTLTNQITTTPPPKTKRQKRTRPAKKVATTTMATAVTTMITTVSATKSSKKHRRKTKPMTATTKFVAPTTNPPKTAMSVIKDHDQTVDLQDAEMGGNTANSTFSSFQTQDKGCQHYISKF